MRASRDEVSSTLHLQCRNVTNFFFNFWSTLALTEKWCMPSPLLKRLNSLCFQSHMEVLKTPCWGNSALFWGWLLKGPNWLFSPPLTLLRYNFSEAWLKFRHESKMPRKRVLFTFCSPGLSTTCPKMGGSTTPSCKGRKSVTRHLLRLVKQQ